MKHLKKIIISSIAGFLSVFIFVYLRNTKVILMECTRQYLNPWQHNFECFLFYLPKYVAIFSLSFLIIFILLKIVNKKSP